MLTRDLVYAARTLRKNPGFTLTAALTIGLGIGASTAMFSVTNAVLLRPLPYTDPERLVLVWGDLRNRNVTDFPFSPPDFADLRKEATSFEEFAGVFMARQPLSGDDGEPEQVRTAGVTPNFFGLLGVRIALGRDFVDSDGAPLPEANAPPGVPPPANAQPAAPRVPVYAILSHAFWQRRFGADPRVLGRSFDLGGGRVQVVGVLAPGFELLFPPRSGQYSVPEVWTAMRLNFQNMVRGNAFLHVIGRMKKGATFEQAQSQIEGIATELRGRFPIKQTAGMHFRLEPMHQDLVRDVQPTILALMGAVIFLLLIACANVANLLLVRASGREREFAVRAALGGSQWSLVRQMLAESLQLAGAGALVGLGLARLGIKLLLVLGPQDLPHIDSIAMDPVVLAFTALSGLVAAALFGVMPALRASRPDLVEALKAGGRTAGLSGGSLLRKGVVIAEVALSFVLLIGSGLMFRSLIALARTDPGYDPRGVLTFFLPLPSASSSLLSSVPRSVVQGQEPQRAAFVQQLRERLRSLPGVQSVSAATPVPLDGGINSIRWGTEEALADPGKFQQANKHVVLPGYFETLRTPLIAGRTFTDADNISNLRLLVIDQLLAAKAFPNQSAVGRRLLARPRTEQPEWFEVIGVVAHQRHTSLANPGREGMFFTDAYMGFGNVSRWVIRATGDPMRLAPALSREIVRLDPHLAVAEVQPMQALVDHAQAQTRFALVLIAIFAGIAALLAAVGLYGVLSAAVRQRTAEIGVRMALGAQPFSIFQLIVGQGLLLSAAGVGLGIVAAFGLTRVMVSMLIGVRPNDPLTFVAIAVLFFLIAALASWLPARRAATLDPVSALREE